MLGGEVLGVHLPMDSCDPDVRERATLPMGLVQVVGIRGFGAVVRLVAQLRPNNRAWRQIHRSRASFVCASRLD